MNESSSIVSVAGFGSLTHDSGAKMPLIVTAMPDGFTLYVLDLYDDLTIGEPRKIAHSPVSFVAPIFSPDGSLVVMHTAEKTGRPEYALHVYDTESGEKVAELWDGEDTSLQAITFSPLPEDGRILANSNRTGTEQLLLWHPQRCRMIVASFLTKDLIINWQWGEKYFMQKLYDGELAANNGGWQWSASSGMDPKPLRIFNPASQAQKFDPEAEYIRLWLPELSSVDTEYLVTGKIPDLERYSCGYPQPIVDHKIQQKKFKELYKQQKERC